MANNVWRKHAKRAPMWVKLKKVGLLEYIKQISYYPLVGLIGGMIYGAVIWTKYDDPDPKIQQMKYEAELKEQTRQFWEPICQQYPDNPGCAIYNR